MDQGVIQSLKKRYKKELLQRLIIEDDLGTSIVDFLKGVNLKVVVDLLHLAWTEISKDTLRKSWRKILPITTSTDIPSASLIMPPIGMPPQLAEL